ncbi:hypothetical protein [Metabacillus sp. Hm71]
MLEEIVYFGKVNHLGEPAEAYREEYTDRCRYIVKVKNKTIVIMEFSKIS